MADDHLSWITTSWSLVRRAHEGEPDDVTAARQLLFERYSGAVRRYLTSVLRDLDTVEELTQEFALELIRGGYRRADSRRGRFRDYVKSSLIYLVGKHRRCERRQPRPVSSNSPVLATKPAPAGDSEEAFDRHWRDHLLTRTWEALSQVNSQFYTVLRFRSEHPELRSEQLAEQLGRRLDRLLTAAAIRQALHRARERFGLLLVDTVAHSLLSPSPERIEEELAALNLLEYCREALARLRGR
jgi:RNA polymerase sigma factor (sigma-70 family)